MPVRVDVEACAAVEAEAHARTAPWAAPETIEPIVQPPAIALSGHEIERVEAEVSAPSRAARARCTRAFDSRRRPRRFRRPARRDASRSGAWARCAATRARVGSRTEERPPRPSRCLGGRAAKSAPRRPRGDDADSAASARTRRRDRHLRRTPPTASRLRAPARDERRRRSSRPRGRRHRRERRAREGYARHAFVLSRSVTRRTRARSPLDPDGARARPESSCERRRAQRALPAPRAASTLARAALSRADRGSNPHRGAARA